MVQWERLKTTAEIYTIRSKILALTAAQIASILVFAVAAWVSVYRYLHSPTHAIRNQTSGAIPSPYELLPILQQEPLVGIGWTAWFAVTLAALGTAWKLT